MVSEEFVNRIVGGKRILFINRTRCGGCGDCMSKCPMNAIHRDKGKISIDNNRCNLCGKCITFCRNERGDAIE